MPQPTSPLFDESTPTPNIAANAGGASGGTQPPLPGHSPVTPPPGATGPADEVYDPNGGVGTTPLFPDGGVGSGADPITETPIEGTTYTAPEITQEETVLGQLGNILNQPNPLFDYAAGKGMQYANSRGLLNSDIAAEASSMAVFGAAMPIAQQDAATYAARHGRAFDATIQSGLMAQGHLQNLVELSKQGDINSQLQLEQFGYNMDLSVQDNIHRLEQLALQGDINSQHLLESFGYDTDLMAQDHGYRIDVMGVELSNALALDGQQHDDDIELMTLQHENNMEQIAASGGIALQQNYLQAAERRTLQFSAEVTAIYSNPGLTPAQQANAVRVARNNYENDIAMLGRLYSSSPGWDPAWGDPTPDMTGPTTGPGPTTIPDIIPGVDQP